MSKFNATKTHCKNGHELSGDNVKKLNNSSGHRVCKICHRANGAKSRESRRALRPPPKTTEERFWEKVNKTEACWLWTAAIHKKTGYGFFGDPKGSQYAHRYSYELHKGKIPADMCLDHLCRVRHCVNPSHLEVVTQQENMRRGIGPSAINARRTHCLRGHEFTPENTYMHGPLRDKRGCRHCRDIRNGCLKARLRNSQPGKL